MELHVQWLNGVQRVNIVNGKGYISGLNYKNKECELSFSKYKYHIVFERYLGCAICNYLFSLFDVLTFGTHRWVDWMVKLLFLISFFLWIKILIIYFYSEKENLKNNILNYSVKAPKSTCPKSKCQILKKGWSIWHFKVP